MGNGSNQSQTNWTCTSFLKNPQCSESRKGTFTLLDKFQTGSIYHNIKQRTGRIGPGSYEDKEKFNKMREKPTTCKMVRPEFGDLDECYEIVGNTKIL
jgi:hypothetical protein